MRNFRESGNIRTEADIRNMVAEELLLSAVEETGDGAIQWNVTHGTLSTTASDLVQDAGMNTAVAISLFTDARADDDEPLPAGETERRGYWADCIDDGDDEETGSLLWLLSREKQTREVVNRAREHARRALQWMVRDRVAAKIDVQARIVRPGWLLLEIDIHRPDGNVTTQRFEFNWLAHERAIGA
ncbi:MAG: phage GP46 family protein [Planctomycetaceae bacterium]|nr:phage GP46 family protein [Planctomycetaceae bacterium]